MASDTEPFRGNVHHVQDVDTLTIERGRDRVVVRLQRIDAPEDGAPFSGRARHFLAEMVLQKTVEVTPVEIDRYGRAVARVYIDGKDVSLELVRAGWAWHFVRYAPNDRELAQAEAEAQAEKRGLWVMLNPVPPWDYRHGATVETDRYQDNVKSLVFHRPRCKHYVCANCTATSLPEREAVAAGLGSVRDTTARRRDGLLRR